MQPTTIAYWPSSGLFGLVLGFSSYAHTMRMDMMLESMTALGFPAYLMSIIGIAKGLGVFFYINAGPPRLR